MTYDEKRALQDYAMRVFMDPASKPEDRDAARRRLTAEDRGHDFSRLDAHELKLMEKLFAKSSALSSREANDPEARRLRAWDDGHDVWRAVQQREGEAHALAAELGLPVTQVCYVCERRAFVEARLAELAEREAAPAPALPGAEPLALPGEAAEPVPVEVLTLEHFGVASHVDGTLRGLHTGAVVGHAPRGRR
jgi:hypothetical protein